MNPVLNKIVLEFCKLPVLASDDAHGCILIFLAGWFPIPSLSLNYSRLHSINSHHPLNIEVYINLSRVYHLVKHRRI